MSPCGEPDRQHWKEERPKGYRKEEMKWKTQQAVKKIEERYELSIVCEDLTGGY